MLLFFYLFTNSCDQFVAQEIRHSEHHCSVCQQSTSYQQRGQHFDVKNIITPRIHSYTRRAIKVGALEMQFVCTFFHICWF